MKPEKTKVLQLKTNILRLSLVLSLAAMGIAASSSAASSIVGRLPGSAVEVSGVVTDTACANTHAGQLRNDAACVRQCIEMGADYAITANEKIYVLKGHSLELNKVAGEGVMIRGILTGRETIQVESVIPWMIETVRTPSKEVEAASDR